MKPKTPLCTTDIIIELGEDKIVLVERKNEPLGWALPGGFVDEGERVSEAAVREAKEETGLDVRLTALLGVYSDPKRDPRGIFTASTVFVARADGTPHGGDDAADARAFSLSSLPQPLVFDHASMLDDYLAFKRDGARPINR
jgi:8-oxo-dGTP diphosphatase